jgi:hypothetical protein
MVTNVTTLSINTSGILRLTMKIGLHFNDVQPRRPSQRANHPLFTVTALLILISPSISPMIRPARMSLPSMKLLVRTNFHAVALTVTEPLSEACLLLYGKVGHESEIAALQGC